MNKFREIGRSLRTFRYMRKCTDLEDNKSVNLNKEKILRLFTSQR